MKTGRNLSVLEHEHRFEKTGDARCGFQMAKIRFDRANRQRRVGGSIAAESFRESMRFDRIADRRASAVRFDKANLLRARSQHPCRRLAPVAFAPPGSAARCRWCVHPD